MIKLVRLNDYEYVNPKKIIRVRNLENTSRVEVETLKGCSLSDFSLSETLERLSANCKSEDLQNRVNKAIELLEEIKRNVSQSDPIISLAYNLLDILNPKENTNVR